MFALVPLLLFMSMMMMLIIIMIIRPVICVVHYLRFQSFTHFKLKVVVRMKDDLDISNLLFK